MARVAPIVLALAGCNQVYGLDQTHLPNDAAAPVRCTNEAPTFRGTPVRILSGFDLTIRSYSISNDRTRAIVSTPGGILEGAADSATLSGASMTPPPNGSWLPPRLAPEGDEFFIGYGATIERYARTGTGWEHKGIILSATNFGFSAPTLRAAGPRHMLLLESSTQVREYVEMAPDQWISAGEPYKPAELGVMSLSEVAMTPDGLHVVAGGYSTLGYASRARLEDRFTSPVTFNPFFGSPSLFDPYVVADCSRLYFIVPSGLQAGVFYVETK